MKIGSSINIANHRKMKNGLVTRDPLREITFRSTTENSGKHFDKRKHTTGSNLEQCVYSTKSQIYKSLKHEACFEIHPLLSGTDQRRRQKVELAIN